MGRRRRKSLIHGVLVVDKPRGPTSHDVVAVARRAFDTTAVGHAGTLDPMATGVLVLALGEATKLVSHLTSADKEYVAELSLGTETDSLDADGTLTESQPVPPLTSAQVDAALQRFVGRTRQTPPRVSAIKVDGRALHARVRSGEDVTPPDRDVVVHEVELHDVDRERGVIQFRVACEKGFYVRSLGRDVARVLGTVGHLTGLRRTRSGAFDLAQAVSFDDLKRARDDEVTRAALAARVIGLSDAWTGPRVTIDEAGAEDAKQGRRIAPSSLVSGDLPLQPAGEASEAVALFDTSGVMLALACPDDEGHLRIARGFVTGEAS